ncbi:MAG TPA: DNA-3-methyladenine glycosylase 2 family protein [Alphaproteobacteria bacterium]|nr:DNA-3-methyladenine glycosylase 2 family protein [Alphaproteobacteria bacterium]
MQTTSFVLNPLPPFRLDLTIWALRRRDRNIIDSWDGTQYIRVFIFNNTPAKVMIKQQTENSHIIITVYSLDPISELETKLTVLLNRMLGLDVNLEEFYIFAKNNKKLYPLVLKFKGLKPPRFPSIFEALTNAIACQQFSLESGLSLLNRLSQHYGLSFQEENKINYAFPEAVKIMNCVPEELKKLGFSQHKSEALINLATEVSKHEEIYSSLEHKSDQDISLLLSDLKGIGRWSTEYALLRGMGRLDVLPGDDVGIKKSLKKLLELDETLDYNKIKQIEQTWFPYAGLIYFHLLLQKLSEKGLISQPVRKI